MGFKNTCNGRWVYVVSIGDTMIVVTVPPSRGRVDMSTLSRSIRCRYVIVLTVISLELQPR